MSESTQVERVMEALAFAQLAVEAAAREMHDLGYAATQFHVATAEDELRRAVGSLRWARDFERKAAEQKS